MAGHVCAFLTGVWSAISGHFRRGKWEYVVRRCHPREVRSRKHRPTPARYDLTIGVPFLVNTARRTHPAYDKAGRNSGCAFYGTERTVTLSLSNKKSFGGPTMKTVRFVGGLLLGLFLLAVAAPTAGFAAFSNADLAGTWHFFSFFDNPSVNAPGGLGEQ